MMNDQNKIDVKNIKNIVVFRKILEEIAFRSGSERGDVFLDILVDIIFRKDQTENLDNIPHQMEVYFQQKRINLICKTYGVTPPLLSGNDEEIPF
jgi:hypothetical protein